MKNLVATTILGSLIATATAQATAVDRTDLEPTMDGAVSATGLYPSQEIEDAMYNR